MSRAKIIQVWAYTLQFMSTFQPLTYRGVRINKLLFRDFQRFCHAHIRLFPPIKNVGNLRSLQKKSARYFLSKRETPLDLSRTGYTLVRGELYKITQGAKKEKFLYVTHRKEEYNMLRSQSSCRPLLYLPRIKAKSNQPELRKIKKQLRQILRAKTTPQVFKKLAFKRWLIQKTNAALRLMDKTATVFQKYPVKQVLYGSTLNSHGALITSFAKSKRIPTINLQHGIFGEYGHLPANADWNLVWGPSHAKFLIQRGANPEQIKIVGPLFSRSLDGRRAKAIVSQSSKNKTLCLLVALQPLGQKYNLRMIQTIDQAARILAKQKRNIHVYYKLHPSQQHMSRYKKTILHPASTILKHGITPLSTLIKRSNLVITPFSTVAYEALIMQKPVLYYGKRRRMYYLRSHPPCFQNTKQLLKWINNYDSEQMKISQILVKEDAQCRPVSIWEVIRQFRSEARASRKKQPVLEVAAKPPEEPKTIVQQGDIDHE